MILNVDTMRLMYQGKTIHARVDDPEAWKYYTGVVTSVDEAGLLHGTWGDRMIVPWLDMILIENEKGEINPEDIKKGDSETNELRRQGKHKPYVPRAERVKE